MGNLCSTPSSPKKSSSMELNPKSNISPAPVMVNNALVAKTHDHTMVLGSDTPEPPEPVITGPTVVLLPHQHTLFCERKQRVCTAVGKAQELEKLKILGFNSSNIRWVWVKSKENNLHEKNIQILPNTQNISEYQLQKEDLTYYIGIQYHNESLSPHETLYTNTIGPILPGPPRILDFHITGDCKIGSQIKAVIQYIGGYEGPSEYWWFRISKDGKRTQVTEPRSIPTLEITSADDPRLYTLTKDDFECTLKVKCRPVRKDLVKGEIFTSKSSKVVH